MTSTSIGSPACVCSSTTEPCASCKMCLIEMRVRPNSTVSCTGMSRIMSRSPPAAAMACERGVGASCAKAACAVAAAGKAASVALDASGLVSARAASHSAARVSSLVISVAPPRLARSARQERSASSSRRGPASPGRQRALQAAWPRDAAILRPVQADAGRLGAASLGPLGGAAKPQRGGSLQAACVSPSQPVWAGVNSSSILSEYLPCEVP